MPLPAGIAYFIGDDPAGAGAADGYFRLRRNQNPQNTGLGFYLCCLGHIEDNGLGKISNRSVAGCRGRRFSGICIGNTEALDADAFFTQVKNNGLTGILFDSDVIFL